MDAVCANTNVLYVELPHRLGKEARVEGEKEVRQELDGDGNVDPR
jgi:hypothetical protein